MRKFSLLSLRFYFSTPSFGLIGLLLVLVWALQAKPAGAASPYKTASVKNGATLTGQAVFKGKVPAPRPFGLIVYPDIELCERISDGKGRRLIRDFSVSPEGGFKNVVISIEGVESGKAFKFGGPKYTIKDCEFYPFRTIARDRYPMTFKNLDGVFHDIQTYAIENNKRGRRIFDRPALPNATMTAEIKLPKEDQKVVWVQCGKHSFMQSWAYVVSNPYFSLTKHDGRFSITDIPPGEYRVTAWHPFMKTREKVVEFKAGQTVELEFLFGAVESSHYKD